MRTALASTVRAPVLLILAAVLAACGSQASQPGPTASARPRSTATLSIVQPRNNAVVSANTMPVQFQLTGGEIVAQTSTHLTPDQGHIHLSIDGRLISMNYQLQQEVRLAQFAPGPHTLQGEFVALDHAPFNPRVIARLIFDYQPPG